MYFFVAQKFAQLRILKENELLFVLSVRSIIILYFPS